MGQEAIRDEFLNTLAHIDGVFGKLKAATGPRSTLHQPDLHKLGEGLLLSGWTHWEEFLKRLLIEDLATDPTGIIRHEARKFRTKNAPWRLAERMLNHPDHPNRFVEWSVYSDIERRASEFLGSGNRFSAHPLPRKNELEYLKRIRNGIAHKSDRAWESFRGLCKNAPFSLTNSQMKGITPGRLLTVHRWNGNWVLSEAIILLRQSAQHLVP